MSVHTIILPIALRSSALVQAVSTVGDLLVSRVPENTESCDAGFVKVNLTCVCKDPEIRIAERRSNMLHPFTVIPTDEKSWGKGEGEKVI